MSEHVHDELYEERTYNLVVDGDWNWSLIIPAAIGFASIFAIVVSIAAT